MIYGLALASELLPTRRQEEEIKKTQCWGTFLAMSTSVSGPFFSLGVLNLATAVAEVPKSNTNGQGEKNDKPTLKGDCPLAKKQKERRTKVNKKPAQFAPFARPSPLQSREPRLLVVRLASWVARTFLLSTKHPVLDRLCSGGKNVTDATAAGCCSRLPLSCCLALVRCEDARANMCVPQSQI